MVIFSALDVSADSHPTALFKVTCSLLGKDEPLNYLKGGGEELASGR